MSIKHRLFPETPGRKHRLGWHQKTDSRSLGEHGAVAHLQSLGEAHLLSKPLESKTWLRRLPPLDQGDLGSCTGNAIAGLLVTEPNASDGVADDVKVTEALAVKIYSLASRLDDCDGAYPPEDTGSDGTSASKAAHQLGLISAYKWCETAATVFAILSHKGPVAFGTPWFAGMEDVDAQGFIHVTGKNEGGHEYGVIAIVVDKSVDGGGFLVMCNSWGSSWGISWPMPDGSHLAGCAKISFKDAHKLIDHHRGDAVWFLPPVKAA